MVTIGIRMGGVEAGLFYEHLEHLCLCGGLHSRVDEVEEAIEIVNPIVKVFQVFFLANVVGLGRSVGQSIWTVYFSRNVLQLEMECKN